MSTELSTLDHTNGVKTFQQEAFQVIEAFTKLLNESPKESELQPTPDKKAKILPISFIESRLDEIYLRQWGTRNVHIQTIANEVLVHLELWVIDPQTNREITRAGFAAIQIMVDAVPERLKWRDGESEQEKRDRNAWSLDMQNKKPNALYLAFPKAKSLALKNAAQSLGITFGRNLNRKHEDTPGDFYGDLINDTAMLSEAKSLIQKASSKEDFQTIWDSYPDLREVPEFKKEYLYYHRQKIK
jgi:hypothetical protein